MISTNILTPPKAPNLQVPPGGYNPQQQQDLINQLRLYFAQVDNSVGQLIKNSYALVQAEVNAGITPVNYAYPPGNVLRYGADNTGAADSTSAIQQAADTGLTIIIPAGTYAVSNTITMHIVGQQLYCFGLIMAMSIFVQGNYVLNVTGQNCVLWTPNIDGNFIGTTCIANGLALNGGGEHIWGPKIVHFPTVGLGFISGVSGDSFCYDPSIGQWNSSDDAFNSDANFTADAILFNRADCTVIGGESRWAGICVHFGSNAATCWLINHHPFNGRSVTPPNPRLDPVIIQVEATASGINIISEYLDNGKIKLFSPWVMIRSSNILQGKTHCIFSPDASGFPTFIQVYYNGNASPYQLDIDVKNILLATDNGTASALGTQFINYLPNGGSFTGDYSGISALMPPSSAQSIKTTNGEFLIHNQSNNTPYTRIAYKPAGVMTELRVVGNNTAMTEVFDTPPGGPNIKTILVDKIVLSPATGATVKIQFGATDVASIYNDGSNNLVLRAGSVDRWEVANGGNFIPVTDATYELGNVTNRISNIYLSPNGGPGFPVLRIDNGVSTGAKTATFSAANKPGTNNVTTPFTWVTVNIDGTLGLMPVFAF